MSESTYKLKTSYPILAVGISMVGFISIKTGRDAVFFSQGDLQQLPLAYIFIAIASVPAAMMHLKAIERWGSRKVRTGVFLVAAFTFLGFVPFVDAEYKSPMMILFVLVPSLFAAVFAGAWLLAGDLLEGASQQITRWAYSRIGAASMIGGIAGGLLAKGLSLFLPPRFLVVSGVVMLIIAGWISSKAHRKHPIKDDSSVSSEPNEVENDRKSRQSNSMLGPLTRELMRQRYILALFGISGLSALAALYIDFQFYAMVTISGKSHAQFFANFYILLNGASLGLQLIVAPWMQSRFGVGGALMVFPTALAGSTGIVSFTTTILSRAILKVTEGGLKSSIHRSTWEQVFLPIGREKRAMAKTLVDGAFARMSEGMGAAVLYIWLSSAKTALKPQALAWISWVIIAAILLWILCTRYLVRLGCADIDGVDNLIRLPDS